MSLNEDPHGRNEHPRMTLTYAGIARARLVVFTVAGESKRPALEAIVAGEDLPASRVRRGGCSGSSTPRPPRNFAGAPR